MNYRARLGIKIREGWTWGGRSAMIKMKSAPLRDGCVIKTIPSEPDDRAGTARTANGRPGRVFGRDANGPGIKTLFRTGGNDLCRTPDVGPFHPSIHTSPEFPPRAIVGIFR